MVSQDMKQLRHIWTIQMRRIHTRNSFILAKFHMLVQNRFSFVTLLRFCLFWFRRWRVPLFHHHSNLLHHYYSRCRFDDYYKTTTNSYCLLLRGRLQDMVDSVKIRGDDQSLASSSCSCLYYPCPDCRRKGLEIPLSLVTMEVMTYFDVLLLEILA